MERENIERLAMDLALGELSEDATALFEAYLAAHPQAHEWARQMQRTCRTAQGAIAAKTRAPCTGELPAGRQSRRVRRIHRPALGRWAAVVVLALLIGAIAGRWSGLQETGTGQQVTVVQSEPAQESWQQVLGGRGQGLWHAKALALLHPSPSASERPAARENLWGTYRRYIKERRDD